MAREYETETVAKKLLEGDEPFYLVDALPRRSYAHRHLPGALSLPLNEVPARAGEVLPDKDLEIIVYCSGPR
jgi:phage shock protein E